MTKVRNNRVALEVPFLRNSSLKTCQVCPSSKQYIAKNR